MTLGGKASQECTATVRRWIFPGIGLRKERAFPLGGRSVDPLQPGAPTPVHSRHCSYDYFAYGIRLQHGICGHVPAVLSATATGMGLLPFVLCVPTVVAASCAFMMPAATPPNAIIVGANYLTIPQMVKAGFALNLIATLLITILTFLVLRPFFGV